MFFVDSLATPKNYFSGIGYSEHCIILSLDGMIKYVAEHHNLLELQSGRYSLVHYDDNEQSSLIMADPTGQDVLYYFQSSDYWAVSNSFYKLVEELKKKKINTEIYLPGLYSYKIKHSLGGQPLNYNTLICNIKILPRDYCIKIKSQTLILEKRTYVLPNITNVNEYRLTLHKVILSQISVLNTLVDLLPTQSVRCDLSGGMDSRVVFGICSNIDNAAKKIKFASNRKLEDDYFIAQKIAQYFGIVLDNSSIGNYKQIVTDKEQFLLYKYGNSGVYDCIYKPHYVFTPKTLHVHGAGGESLRGQYLGSPRQIMGRLKSYFSSEVEHNLVQKEFFNYFSNNNLDINDPRSMINHYRDFRARFHFGRNWFRFLTNPLYTPLSDIRLESLSNYLSVSNKNSTMIFYDIYMFLHDILAFFPFDDDKKNINLQKMKSVNIPLVKSEQNRKLTEYVVYGEFLENKIDKDLISSIDTTLAVPFGELLNLEKDEFVKKFPSLSSGYSQMPHVYTILNLID
ncbi:hypothetical protein [Wohlfahrtiimonas larvae]|uniref:Asparagine synthetase domain-containing protein n=1 Tax=Wohlfahrtiimonas larvae TaxID=1157986 RepID=A0ABP9MPU0_9GAMM|nr:hypothetical protein [Wohlfahrtiimonas larvae]